MYGSLTRIYKKNLVTPNPEYGTCVTPYAYLCMLYYRTTRILQYSYSSYVVVLK